MADQSSTPLTRRDLLRLLLLGGVSAAAAKVILDSPILPFHLVEAGDEDRVLGPEHSWAMVIDLKNCIGCDYCTNACQATNNWPAW